MNEPDPIFGEVISAYTRAQAIDDGVLVDVSATAREHGITFPVAVTCGVWSQCVAVPSGVAGQDESGRLWDVITMLFVAIRRGSGCRCDFKVYVRNHNRERLTKRDLVALYALCGPGDDSAPVITIMLPDED